ncbi:MAG: tetratricopeptide repeat protein, partial [Armatimonadetes bacterium]|nr:tetratricopeptide repeat protein [Armatimonadota bacterium]
MDRLLSLFEVSFETPNVAAEIARHRAWAPPVADEVAACDGLARVIRDYPRTSDARRALLDIGGIYARKGDWRSAEAPFRYVMEMMEGQSAARIAHFRLIELYRYAGTPQGVDAIDECRAAVAAYAGTDEEGLGRMLLADMLAARESFQPAFEEFQRVVDRFPGRPYTNYARIR